MRWQRQCKKRRPGEFCEFPYTGRGGLVPFTETRRCSWFCPSIWMSAMERFTDSSQPSHEVRKVPKTDSCAATNIALHSSTTSARNKNESGILRPMAFAVLRLIVSSNFVGCSMGMSFGCLPCRIF
jgi:hypothetical protein